MLLKRMGSGADTLACGWLAESRLASILIAGALLFVFSAVQGAEGEVLKQETKTWGGQSLHEVTVRATGSSLSDARNEAIRLALYSTVRQLVITERLVSDSELVMNDIYATQNGFIEKFELLESFRNTHGDHEIKATVRVSDESILNYAVFKGVQSSELDGASLFAEAQRSASHEKALQKMFRRFFYDYPSDVYSLQLEKIRPVAGHTDLVEAIFTSRIDPNYLSALHEFVRQIAEYSYIATHDLGRVRLAPRIGVFETLENLPQGYVQNNGAVHGDGHDRSQSSVCIGESGSKLIRKPEGSYMSVHCYLLPALRIAHSIMQREDGNELVNSVWNGFLEYAGSGELSFLVSFLDSSGASVVSSETPVSAGECLELEFSYLSSDTSGKAHHYGGMTQGNVTNYSLLKGSSTGVANIVMTDVEMSYLAQLEMDWGNFSEAKTFIGMPVIVIGSPYVSAGRGAKRGFVGIDGKVKPLETFCREMVAAHRIQ